MNNTVAFSAGEGPAGAKPPPLAPSPAPRRIALTDRGLLSALVLIGVGWLAYELRPVILTVVMALVLVGTLHPLTAYLTKRGLSRTLATIVIFVVLAGVLVVVGLVTIPSLLVQARDLFEGAPALQQHLAERLARNHLTIPIANTVRGLKLQDLVIPSGKQAFAYTSQIVTVIGWGLTTFALSFYFLADPSTTQAALYGVVPRRFHMRLARIMLNLETIVGGYMRGQIITSALMCLFTYVLLRLCGVKNALPLAVFAGVTDVLPLIGGILGAIPLVVAVLPHGTATVVIVVVSVVIYQEMENRLIIPRVYGRVLRLPAWAITLALLAGAELMGVTGALLSLPVAAGVRMILEELRVELPGDGAVDAGIRERDERVETLYAELAAGAGPGTSAEIAIDIAGEVRKADAADPTDAAEVPVTGGEPPASAAGGAS